MTLSVEYETLEEATMRLQHTVVMYDGEPVYIVNVRPAKGDEGNKDIFRVIAAPLPVNPDKPVDEEVFRKYISSKKFDLSTLKMGMMNLNGQVYYLSRAPKRQYKQGLAQGTLSISKVGEKIPGAVACPKFSALIASQHFVDMVHGKYPKFNNAVAELKKEKVGGIAFSREYCLVKDQDIDTLIYLYHKNDKVGFIYGDNVMLAKNMKCLRETLQGFGLKV